MITEIMNLIRLLGSIGEVLPKQSSYHIITWLANQRPVPWPKSFQWAQILLRKIIMAKFMCTHTLPPGTFSEEQLRQLAQAAQQDATVKGLRRLS